MSQIDKILDFKPTGLEIEKGKLLLSEPFLKDYFFKRGVILMLEHDKFGSMGMVINRETEYYINDLVDGFPEFESKVFLGGPVQTENIFILHRKGDLINGSQEILPGLYWGGDFEQIKELIGLGVLKNTDLRFYLGYSGWSENQLQNELKENSWIVAEAKNQYLFVDQPKDLWKDILEIYGNDYELWLNFPVDPQAN
ncbi:MAG: YqgE/AlgH family protein [Bacteroidetes bacterium]|nr:MAG: YqgE/AlgH family protein [Bacteroidota bacterium]